MFFVKDSALRMNKKHMYINNAWWGREGDDACLEHGFWIIHVILYTYILIMNVMMISSACVPTSFVQDCCTKCHFTGRGLKGAGLLTQRLKARGALTLKKSTGMCCSHDPFFQASRCSLAYQFTINGQLMCPSFQFSAVFWPKFQLWRCKFSFQRPLIFQGKSAP